MKKDNLVLPEKHSIFRVYLWCLSFLKPIKTSVFVLMVLGIITSFSELLIPKLIQQLVDKVFPTRDFNHLIITLLMVTLLFIIKFSAESVSQILKISIQEKAASLIHMNMIKKLHSLGLPFIENNPVGKILSLFNTEVVAIQKLYRYYFPELIRSLVFGIIAVGLMINISFILSLVIIPCFFLYYTVGPYLDKKSSYAAKEYSNSEVSVGHKIYESISALRDIKVFNVEDWNLNHLQLEIKNNIRWSNKSYFYSFLRGSIRRFSYHLGAITLFIIGSHLITQNQITIGEFVAFILIYFNTMWRLTRIITILNEQSILMHRAEKLYVFLNTSVHLEQTLDNENCSLLNGNISFRNVSFSYNKTVILDNISFDIKKGDKVAILGKSGCGKTTLLKLLTRFYDPINGDILYSGESFRFLATKDIRSQLGIVYQDPFLFGASIYDNILFGKLTASKEMVVKAAKIACLHDFILTLPDGYNTFIGERGVNLSGGQKQRLSLARAFLRNPTILILDEPTSSLDNITENSINQALDYHFRDTTVITVAHRLNTIRNYNNIIVLNQGKIVEQGTYDELYMNKGYFYDLISDSAEVEVFNG